MTRRGRLGAVLGLAVAAAGAVGAVPRAGQTSAGQVGWQETLWPFPRDAWPVGRAFRCGGAGCGGAMEVYIRPKVGFCNCATGVSGDAEVDGVSDLDMLSPEFRPRAAGQPAAAAGMAGRTRRYVLTSADGREHDAAGFALAAGCDLVVAAALGPAAGTDAGRDAILALLASPDVAGWIRSKLGKA